MNKKQERLLSKPFTQNDRDIAKVISETIGRDITDRSIFDDLKITLILEQEAQLNKIIEFANEPAPIEYIKGWLETMWAITPKGRDRICEKKLILEDYSEFLTVYPADIARAVTKEVFKWFPSKLEVQQFADAKVGKRKLYLGRIKRICERQLTELDK